MPLQKSATETVTWVIGSGGLLGSSILAAIEKSPHFTHISAKKMMWEDPKKLAESTHSNVVSLLKTSLKDNKDWAIIWAAGAGVVGADQKILNREVSNFALIFRIITEQVELLNAGSGNFFFSSSAGGIYGGSQGAPFDEYTTPSPISPYGEARLKMEEKITQLSKKSKIKLVIGRIANLYGPGQDLSKKQGLVSQLVKSQFISTPVSIFVPLDTRRDYLYVEDCAVMILQTIQIAKKETDLAPKIKIYHSGSSVSIGSLIGYVRSLTKKRPNVLIGQSPVSSQQSLDLTLKTEVWPEISEYAKTGLPSGIMKTKLDILNRIQSTTKI